MKKILIATMLCLLPLSVFADDGAVNIRLKVATNEQNNRFFLCLPDVGCLSLLAAERGKVFPVYEPIDLGPIFIADAATGLSLKHQTDPSCQMTVPVNKTLTISGDIRNGDIQGLHCSVS